MNEEKETCYFSSPQTNRCSILDVECTGSRSQQLCSFHKTEREYFEERNKAVEKNRLNGNCAKCKYKSEPCELVVIGGETS